MYGCTAQRDKVYHFVIQNVNEHAGTSEVSLLYVQNLLLWTMVCIDWIMYSLRNHYYTLRNNETKCMCNVTLRHVGASITAVEKLWVLSYERVFVAIYIQRSMRMYHIVICGLPHSTTFSHHYPINSMIKKKKLLKMRVLSLSTILVWNTFHSKKNWARYDRKCVLVFVWSTLYSLRL